MAIPPLGVSRDEVGGPDGYSYGAVLLQLDAELQDVLDLLRDIRFSGWVSPPNARWVVVLGERGAGVVASERRGVLDVGALVAGRVTASVLAVQVRRDRQLSLVGWEDGEEVGRYCSDPSLEPGADDDVLAEPVGAASAVAFARLAGREDAADDLIEILDEELDPESVYESERLRQVLRLLGMPDWLVAADALPRDIPTGPRARDLTRLRAGVPGAPGVLRDLFVRRLRRRRTPPPAIADPPRGGGMSGLEPWMF